LKHWKFHLKSKMNSKRDTSRLVIRKLLIARN
jgi:hypothetical protein